VVKLFVAGLNQEFDVIRLVELFSLHGAVEEIKVVTDKVSGKVKGFAFMHMSDERGAARAIEGLNGVSFDGKKLEVKRSVEK